MRNAYLRDIYPTEDLTERMKADPRSVVEDAEYGFHQQLNMMSEKIVRHNTHIVLLCGPSASGKTTTANLLVGELLAQGRHAIRISLDDFYRDRDVMPLWEDGSKNFETVEALDLDYLHRCTEQLVATGHADFPVFDFVSGRRSKAIHPIDYDENTIIVFEGIHALHPRLRQGMRDCLGIYIHPNTNYVDAAGKVVLDARDLRLVRRIIRDNLNRGTAPIGTIDMWDDVLRGELLYMKPDSRYADYSANTSHDYEPFLYCGPILQLLEGIREPGRHRETIERLIESFRAFFPIGDELVPGDSLIREFIRKQ